MIKIAAICCFVFILCSCEEKAKEPVVYHSDRVIIFWMPDRQEDNDTYHTAEAMSYIVDREEIPLDDSSKSIGFAYQGDTTLLNKKEVYEEKGLGIRIILFDGKTKPIVTTPSEISNNKFSWFFKEKTKEEEEEVVSNVKDTAISQKNEYNESHLKFFQPKDFKLSKMGNFGEAVIVGIWKSDSLIRKILKQNETNSLRCVDVGDGCDECRNCVLSSDSVFIDYLEKPDGRYPGYVRILAEDVPMFGGKVRIGMSWKEFSAVAETNVKYQDSKYIKGVLETSEVFFYFANGVLKEVIESSTL